MIEQALPSAAAHKLTISSTAISLLAAIQTAASDASYKLPENLDAIEIDVESGSNLRILTNGQTPTAVNGNLIMIGELRTIEGVNLKSIMMIREGSSDSVINVRLGKASREAKTASARTPAVFVDGLEATLTAILAAIDGLEALAATIDADTSNLAAILTSVDGLETLLGTIDADTSALNSFLLPSALRPVAFDSFATAVMASTTGTDQTVIADPGDNKQIWVYGIDFVPSAAASVDFHDAGGVDRTGIYPLLANQPWARMSSNLLMPLFKCASSTALQATITAGNINGTIQYAIVSV